LEIYCCYHEEQIINRQRLTEKIGTHVRVMQNPFIIPADCHCGRNLRPYSPTHVAACVGHVAADVGLQQQHSSDNKSCNSTAVQASSQHGNVPKISDSEAEVDFNYELLPSFGDYSTTSVAHLWQISIPMRSLSC